jgi:predicted dehydrogenase
MTEAYSLATGAVAEVPAPVLPYRPPMPRDRSLPIALVGAGGIAPSHLRAYRDHGLNVRVIASRSAARAAELRDACFPGAEATGDVAGTLARPDIAVVDLTPHPADRVALIEAALAGGKHVLSQKPFVLDLDTGHRLCDLAEARGRILAVNQNGRWAPHLSWMREAVRAGHVGSVQSVHLSVHWDHSWIAGTPFERIEDLILYDFGIHWFDFLRSVIGRRAQTVFATAAHATNQTANAPLLAQVLVQMEGGQASLVFDGATPHGPRDTTYIAGTKGSLQSDGRDLGQQSVTLTTAAGIARPQLQGTWFNDGFRGAMGALLVAIEDDTKPANGAEENLESLALAFAAIQSRRTGRACAVGSVTAISV